MRAAAPNLEFEEAARLRDELKRLKLLDLECANEVMTPAGEAVDAEAPARERKAARAESEARFRKGRRQRLLWADASRRAELRSRRRRGAS